MYERFTAKFDIVQNDVLFCFIFFNIPREDKPMPPFSRAINSGM